MANDLSFTTELESKMKQYEIQLEDLNDKITKLTTERDALLPGYNACKTLLDIENHDSGTSRHRSEIEPLPFDEIPNFAKMSIPAAAEAVLKDSRRPLSNADLVREIRKRGKGMEGPNSYNILYSSLKRNPGIFKKQGSLWTLVNKNLDSKVA